MDAVEFALAEGHEPHLFVVRKQVRSSAGAGKAAVSSYYYILGHERFTYQAPTLHAAVTARLRRAMHFVADGFARCKVRRCGGESAVRACVRARAVHGRLQACTMRHMRTRLCTLQA